MYCMYICSWTRPCSLCSCPCSRCLNESVWGVAIGACMHSTIAVGFCQDSVTRRVSSIDFRCQILYHHHAYTHARAHTHARTRTHTHTHTHTHSLTHTYTHTHAHTRTHIHIQPQRCGEVKRGVRPCYGILKLHHHHLLAQCAVYTYALDPPHVSPGCQHTCVPRDPLVVLRVCI